MAQEFMYRSSLYIKWFHQFGVKGWNAIFIFFLIKSMIIVSAAVWNSSFWFQDFYTPSPPKMENHFL